MFVLRRYREKVENLDFAHSEPAAVMSVIGDICKARNIF